MNNLKSLNPYNTMEVEHFLTYLKEKNLLDKVYHINSDGMPNMKHKYIRDMYHEFLYNQTPSFECSICMENIKSGMCKLNCGHCFCIECFSNLARTSNNCALCRSKLTKDVVKKEINQDIIIDVVNHELLTQYEERDNMNVYECVENFIKKFVEGANYTDSVIANTADNITMEIFDSLHSVAYMTMRSINNQ